MLKSIIQNDNLCIEGRNCMVPHDPAITTDEHWHPWRVGRKNEGLVS
jgi:hypothetical protein